MKSSTAYLSALASATLLSQAAIAGPIKNVNTDVDLTTNQAAIEHVLTGGNAGATFVDRYNFTLTQAGDFNADLAMRDNRKQTLNLTGFTLFDAAGTALGSAGSNWALDFDGLSAGRYYLQITGEVLSNAAGKYYANLLVSPSAIAEVPEPAPIGMMLAGLGLVGLTAQRRKAKAAKRA